MTTSCCSEILPIQSLQYKGSEMCYSKRHVGIDFPAASANFLVNSFLPYIILNYLNYFCYITEHYWFMRFEIDSKLKQVRRVHSKYTYLLHLKNYYNWHFVLYDTIYMLGWIYEIVFVYDVKYIIILSILYSVTWLMIETESGKKMTGCYSPWRLVANKLGVVHGSAR